MDKFGQNLSFYFNQMSKRDMNLVSTYTLGMKILGMLEIIHEAGYVYNDLSMDKIVLD